MDPLTRLDTETFRRDPVLVRNRCLRQESQRGAQQQSSTGNETLMALQHVAQTLLAVNPLYKTGHRDRRQAVLGLAVAFFTALLLLITFAIQEGSAHEVRPMIATVTAGDGGSVEVALSINLEAAMAGIGPEHDDTSDSPAAPIYDRLRALAPEELSREFRAFAPIFLDRLDIDFDGGDATPTISEMAIPPVDNTSLARISNITLTAQAPAGSRSFTWRLDRNLGDSVVRVRSSGSDEIEFATHVPAGETAGPVDLHAPQTQTAAEVFSDYLRLGFTHILPKGLDHILFVVGLFLLSSRLSTLAWQVSAFTVAHTLTIALGTLGIVNIPGWIVEPLIALSIAWIAIENMLTIRLHRWRLAMVFGFGLLHGLGFASVLGEIGLSTSHFVTGLVAFNVGVELGQLAVLALCFLAVGWLMRWPRYRTAVVMPASLAIAMIALFWVVERTVMA
ncbi:MAG: HupE/UreJ family protein [Actinomycetota bacterium]